MQPICDCVMLQFVAPLCVLNVSIFKMSGDFTYLTRGQNYAVDKGDGWFLPKCRLPDSEYWN